MEAKSLATRLLDGASFGIVQHPRSATFLDEYEAIRKASKKRALVDNKHVLEAQVTFLNDSLTHTQKRQYCIEGRLHAHDFRRENGGAQILGRVWMDEYSRGCDRDQIAYYGAAARLNLTLQQASPCSKYPFNRTGLYVSELNQKFTARVHCDFAGLLV